MLRWICNRYYHVRHSRFLKVTIHRLLIFLFVLSATGLAVAEDVSTSEFTPVLPKRELYDQGRWIYEQNCMICHGRDGDGKGELAAATVPKPRPFASGVFKFHTTPSGKMPTNDDLRRTVTGGLAGTAMGMFNKFPPDDLEAVIEYVKSFSRKWRKTVNYGPPLPEPVMPEWFAKENELKAHAAKGSLVFGSTCMICHGAEGAGDGPALPALKDMWGEPAKPADLREQWLRRGTDIKDVYWALMTGRDGTPMISYAEILSDEQRWDLVAFIQTLRTKKAEATTASQ